MFRNNNQPGLFSFETELLGQKQQQKLKDSKEKWFHKLVFSNINEDNSKYIGTKEYANYQRVFKDHFIVINQQVEVKPNSELHSRMLQSPDDSEATYRKKMDEETRGFIITATETAHPCENCPLKDNCRIFRDRGR